MEVDRARVRGKIEQRPPIAGAFTCDHTARPHSRELEALECSFDTRVLTSHRPVGRRPGASAPPRTIDSAWRCGLDGRLTATMRSRSPSVPSRNKRRHQPDVYLVANDDQVYIGNHGVRKVPSHERSRSTVFIWHMAQCSAGTLTGVESGRSSPDRGTARVVGEARTRVQTRSPRRSLEASAGISGQWRVCGYALCHPHRAHSLAGIGRVPTLLVRRRSIRLLLTCLHRRTSSPSSAESSSPAVTLSQR